MPLLSNVDKIFLWYERQGLDEQGRPVVYTARGEEPPKKKMSE